MSEKKKNRKDYFAVSTSIHLMQHLMKSGNYVTRKVSDMVTINFMDTSANVS